MFPCTKTGKGGCFYSGQCYYCGVAGKEGVEYEAISGIYSPGLYSIGVPLNDSKWRDKVSFVLQDLMRDGTYDKIYEKWFGKDGMYPLEPSAKPVLSENAFGENQLYVWPD